MPPEPSQINDGVSAKSHLPQGDGNKVRPMFRIAARTTEQCAESDVRNRRSSCLVPHNYIRRKYPIHSKLTVRCITASDHG